MSRLGFLESILPPLKVGDLPGISFDEFRVLCRDNLNATAEKSMHAIRTYIDLKNVERSLKGAPIDTRGNLSEKELQRALADRVALPSCLLDFLEEYPDAPDRLRHYSKVLSAHLCAMKKSQHGFLKKYFHFEWEWRILLAGYRAKKLGKEIGIALQYEDSHDPMVAEIFAQKDTPHFEFPFEYAALGEKLKKVGSDPVQQYWLLATFRFEQIEEMVQDRPFSIDKLLGYLAQLIIVEDAFSLDEKGGSARLNEMVKR